MYPTFPAEHQTRAPLIHRYYAQLEWEHGRPRAALLVLMTLIDKGIHTPFATILVSFYVF